ncbi:hypothetical protein BY996DRAFT_7115789 [Phakopsora pachyrhizi]|nr:hypothetical protein BY996DRAFT_7115789 [Phakopsora pachyrhizi]
MYSYYNPFSIASSLRSRLWPKRFLPAVQSQKLVKSEILGQPSHRAIQPPGSIRHQRQMSNHGHFIDQPSQHLRQRRTSTNRTQSPSISNAHKRSGSRKPYSNIHSGTHLNHSQTFKSSVIPETILIVIGIGLSIYRLSTLDLKNLDTQTQLPIGPLIKLSIIFLTVSLARHYYEFRTQSTYSFRVTFTDHRGYRDVGEADDGLMIGVGIPLIVASALLCSSINQLNSFNGTLSNPLGPTLRKLNLIDLWNGFGDSRFIINFEPIDFVRSLAAGRIDLLCFIIVNLISLAMDLGLCASLIKIQNVSSSNLLRLIGSHLKSFFMAVLIAIGVRLNCFGPEIRQSMTFFESFFSVFTFQSSLYLSSRLTRRAFTLGESLIFTSTGSALMIELIRLTSSRLKYSSFLKTRNRYNLVDFIEEDSIKHLPKLFRFPTPVVAIQHVTVSGVFLIGFILSPLLVWSRTLGQRPTKRSKINNHVNPSFATINNGNVNNSSSKVSSQSSCKPTSLQVGSTIIENGHEQYYQRFSNPEQYHQSRQIRTESKDRMRRILAISIYTSVIWIVLVVLSHWLGWLFEINIRGRRRHLNQKTAWWEDILGPGWVWFLKYSLIKNVGVVSHRNYKEIREKATGFDVLTDNGEVTANKVIIEWGRVIIFVYWLVCLAIGIGGWTTYLVKKRKFKTMTRFGSMNHYHHHSNNNIALADRKHKQSSKNFSQKLPEFNNWRHPDDDTSQSSMSLSAQNFVNGVGISGGIVYQQFETMVIGDSRKTPKKELNLRRKFFHGLALMMFVPPIISDPEFCSIGFTGAFTIFTFFEFARYFALYPIGAAIHVFFVKFLFHIFII